MGEFSPKPPFSKGDTNMIDRYTFEGEDFDDMSAPRSCETSKNTHCPFTGELIADREQVEIEPNFENDFLDFINTSKGNR